MTRLQIIKDTAENNYFTGSPGDGTHFIFDGSVRWLVSEIERLRNEIDILIDAPHYTKTGAICNAEERLKKDGEWL